MTELISSLDQCRQAFFITGDLVSVLNSRPHTINNIVNIRRIDNIIDRVRAAGLSIILNVCAHIILTSIKKDIVNIDIDNIIDRVLSANGYRWIQ